MPLHLAPVAFSLAAVVCWGISDFTGGYASQRANAFVVTAIGHASGLILVTGIALGTHAAFPSHRSVAWGLAAGVSGGVALALFYRALATGQMGLTAPVSAVLGAAIPTAVGIFFEGAPHASQILGFALAGMGIWLISRPEHAAKPATENRSDGIGLATIAGIGFAGFFLCMRQAGNASPFWIASASRVTALSLTIAIVAIGRIGKGSSNAGSIRLGTAELAVLAGCLDVSGSVMFLLASQAGRLDEAVVLASLYPVVTVLLARFILHERLTRWKTAGMIAALLAVPLISAQ